ncbi:MAG: type I methionyl aminopeptidase [Candidatus Omnitrophica bacterium]|nr:type I methionyl aminopeptidase [Candidatus Omnitrophota bacterium]MBU1047861.1 type I methionyl aminopeptidase [Candidatus Omnitrophota bacterium]MBU1631280.1 type I methionyl aminopeptidase [Candidatus Omnitrophota bacterium]MBU1766711.1 type I methionyl aminopeptidase [Candidatus Omnitrophota bacterium]MBU1888484.1 type I methionyl aminopeptidase [Candidatus Omnitrophota bacterium]
MIPIKSKEEIKILSEANKIVARILKSIKTIVAPGINTKELELFAEDLINKEGAIPAFKGYMGYPSSICASINEEVVHGIPSDKRILKNGDIVSIDLGVKVKGYYGDAAVTYSVGEISDEAKELIEVTEKALYKGIEKARAGNYLFDISWAIQSLVEDKGYGIIRDFVGHGIGKQLHEGPQIPNFGKPHTGPILREGMVLAIEPMVSQGTWEVKVLDDGWTAVTLDNSLACHFEHTIAIMKNGPVILSKE